MPEYVESRRSGTKKCCSEVEYGVVRGEEFVVAIGIGGTGGTSRSGDPGPDLLVTPGI